VHLQGWIFDLYPSPQGMTLWLIEANQKRHRLIDRFTAAFYVRGLPESLKRLEQALKRFVADGACRFTERTDLWENRAVPVLEITVAHPTQFSSWVRWVHRICARASITVGNAQGSRPSLRKTESLDK